jgi:hypothetical protein
MRMQQGQDWPDVVNYSCDENQEIRHHYWN